jgi:Fe(3+) dicitrate transport protein
MKCPTFPATSSRGTSAWSTGRFAVNVAGTYVDKTREIAGDGPLEPSLTTDAYFLLDASAKLILSEHWELSLNARNLLDETYIASRRPFGARPGAPRWMQAGVRATF